jgi:hypothetical protein
MAIHKIFACENNHLRSGFELVADGTDKERRDAKFPLPHSPFVHSVLDLRIPNFLVTQSRLYANVVLHQK